MKARVGRWTDAIVTDIASRRDIGCECRGIRLLAQTYLYQDDGILLFQFNTRKHKIYVTKEVVGYRTNRTSASLRQQSPHRHYYLLSQEQYHVLLKTLSLCNAFDARKSHILHLPLKSLLNLIVSSSSISRYLYALFLWTRLNLTSVHRTSTHTSLRKLYEKQDIIPTQDYSTLTIPSFSLLKLVLSPAGPSTRI
jgi:hypothetical protein